MSLIDYNALITAEARARTASDASAVTLKAECTDLIAQVLDMYTLSNLRSASDLEELTAADMATFRAGQRWVSEMRSACRTAIASDSTPLWPPVPEGLAALAKAY